MQDRTEAALMQPRPGEAPDISPGAFRFIAVLCAAGLVLMVAGIL
jgi:hypothetical protein